MFGPETVFPFAPKRKYTPCDAPKEKLFELRDFLGFTRNVIVQATCHGHDDAALVDALEASDDKARGVASVRPDITQSELKALDAAGVRGVRFNFVRRLVDFTPREVLTDIAKKIAPLGWHVVVYFEAQDLEELAPFFTALPTKVIVDHMGRPDVSRGLDHPHFQQFVALLDNNPHIWTKVSGAERLSVQGPPYDDFVPFARAAVERFPDRVLWGTDWPHPNLKSHMPNDGVLCDILPRIASTEALQKSLLVSNPMRLYWK